MPVAVAITRDDQRRRTLRCERMKAMPRGGCWRWRMLWMGARAVKRRCFAGWTGKSSVTGCIATTARVWPGLKML
jgi:hypothetical protein